MLMSYAICDVFSSDLWSQSFSGYVPTVFTDVAQQDARKRLRPLIGVDGGAVAAEVGEGGIGMRALGVGHGRVTAIGRIIDLGQIAAFGHAGIESERGIGIAELGHRPERLGDRKSTRMNSSHYCASRKPSSA